MELYHHSPNTSLWRAVGTCHWMFENHIFCIRWYPPGSAGALRPLGLHDAGNAYLRGGFDALRTVGMLLPVIEPVPSDRRSDQHICSHHRLHNQQHWRHWEQEEEQRPAASRSAPHPRAPLVRGTGPASIVQFSVSDDKDRTRDRG